MLSRRMGRKPHSSLSPTRPVLVGTIVDDQYLFIKKNMRFREKLHPLRKLQQFRSDLSCTGEDTSPRSQRRTIG